MISPSEPSAGAMGGPQDSPPRSRGKARLDLLALALCLVGLIGLVAIVWENKTGAASPSRPLLLACLALVCSPFYLVFVRTPKLPYLVAPIVTIFLLYPIASPHGVVYTSDPIFNYSFANNILSTGYWVPGRGEAYTQTYSFYPVGNVFNSFVIAAGRFPADQAYMWVEPLIRLAAIPALVYAIGRRLFGPRTAILGMLLYLGTASILFNVPVQQGMGVIFVGLALLALIILTQEPSKVAKHRVMVLFVISSGAIVMTHHLSSYVFAGWFATLVALAARRRNRRAIDSGRLALLLLFYVEILGLYVALFTYRIFATQQLTVTGVLESIVAPEQLPRTQAPALGRTFNLLELAWLGGSILGILLFAILTILRHRALRQRQFATANAAVAAGLTLITLPLLVTTLSYIPLRIGEYTNLFLAPFAAATLLRVSHFGIGKWARWLPRAVRQRPKLLPVSAALVCALLLMGGNLAPISIRTYYEPEGSRATDTQLNLGQDSLRAADWATAHFGANRVWGDQLAIDVYVGFSNMKVDFGSKRIFENTSMVPEIWARLAVGDYIVVDSYMLVLRPNWLHEPLSPEPLTPAQVGKFAADPHLALVYQDATYSVYRVMSKPP